MSQSGCLIYRGILTEFKSHQRREPGGEGMESWDTGGDLEGTGQCLEGPWGQDLTAVTRCSKAVRPRRA